MEKASKPMPIIEGVSAEESTQLFDLSICHFQAMVSQELYASQLEVDHLPCEMGDTLALQLGHLKKIHYPRNKLVELFSCTHLPQLSQYHIRHIEV